MVGLAKLTPPSATGLLPRERLFARLDAAFQQRLAWIAAPAGSGKTSLAASWLAARGPAPVWYRVDADDADPANFFHYLALAAGDPGADLPALTPEYLPGLATFARRFFRALFAALPTPFVLVLDNYQEVPAASPLHGLVDILAEELPVGGGLLAISRLGPPPALARACARGMVLDYGDLRFTPAETADLFRLLGLSDADRVHAASDGWAVGIVLTARGSGSGFAGAGQSRQALFDFIAAEFFDPLPAERREFLLRVGVLPVVTEGLCVALTGDSRGLAWLDELRREHLFITVQARGERAYEFHPPVAGLPRTAPGVGTRRRRARRGMAPGRDGAGAGGHDRERGGGLGPGGRLGGTGPSGLCPGPRRPGHGPSRHGAGMARADPRPGAGSVPLAGVLGGSLPHDERPGRGAGRLRTRLRRLQGGRRPARPVAMLGGHRRDFPVRLGQPRRPGPLDR
ncbi:MAG: hypothetical protein IPN00_11175 [Hydrogenophilales bacterium]|nr:hypothetical protein [Hydrogenophilales bacterium]